MNIYKNINILLLVIGILFINVNCQQIDITFCDIDKLPADPANLPFPKQNVSGRFQVNVERNDGLIKETEEIYELYDGSENLGISTNTLGSLTTTAYSYYKVNELLLVLGENCRVLKLNESYEASPFYVTTIDGQQHIISQLGFLIQIAQKFVYTGADKVRGILINNWQTCIYSPKQQSTLKITLSFSDPTKWISSFGAAYRDAVPVQAKIESKKTGTNEVKTEFLSYTKFKPVLSISEEKFFTPRGVYCEGRKNVKPLPKIDFRSFSAINQLVIPSDDIENSGSIATTRSEYDFDNKLFRADIVLPNRIMTKIDDYNTGLSYTIDRAARNCSIAAIGPNSYDAELGGQFLAIKDPVELFNFNGTPEFHWVGLRRVKGIETDVWVSKRKMNGDDSIWEWHFSSDNWISQEANGIKQNEPVLLAITFLVPVLNPFSNTTIIVRRSVFNYFGAFDQTRITLFDFDITACERNQIRRKHLRFSLPTDQAAIIRTNLAIFKQALMLSIENTATVTLLRISELETIFEMDQIYVVFTLLDRPSFYGNVNRTKEDLSLDAAFKKLSDTVSSDQFIISFAVDANQKYGIKVIKDSLIELERRDGRYVYDKIEKDDKTGYSGGTVAAITIIMTIIGLALGLVGGIFLILKRPNNSPLPGPLGFLNPNFKEAASSTA